MADGKILKLTESDTKRRKKDKDSKRRASQVNIGTSIDKWTLQRNTLGIDNETLAAVLLDIYAIHQSCKVVALSPILATSTPAHLPKPGKIDYESESDGSYSDMSGVEMLKSIHGETSFVQEAVGDVCSWHRGYNKNSARWRAVAVKVQKTYSYMPDLLTEIFRSRIEDTGSISRHVELLENDPRRIAGTIAATQPDATAHIVAAHVTRRKHSDVP